MFDQDSMSHQFLDLRKCFLIAKNFCFIGNNLKGDSLPWNWFVEEGRRGVEESFTGIKP